MRKEVDTVFEEKNDLTREDLYCELLDFYEAAGFWPDLLVEEFSVMSYDELLTCYQETFPNLRRG